MRKIYSTLLLGFIILPIQTWAQSDNLVSVNGDFEQGKFVVRSSTRGEVAGTFSFVFEFKQLENFNSQMVVLWSGKVPGDMFALEPLDPEKRSQIGEYSYRYLRGDYLRKANKNFVYRLPFSVSRSSTFSIRESTTHYAPYFNEGVESAHINFNLQQGDTIYAARKGTVVDIIKIDQNEINQNLTYLTIVEHADGTLARYQTGETMVKINDIVYPDTPIATAASYNSDNYYLRLYIYFVQHNSKMEKELYYESFNPIFATTEGNIKLVSSQKYTPAVSNEIIDREKTKKERLKANLRK